MGERLSHNPAINLSFISLSKKLNRTEGFLFTLYKISIYLYLSSMSITLIGLDTFQKSAVIIIC